MSAQTAKARLAWCVAHDRTLAGEWRRIRLLVGIDQWNGWDHALTVMAAVSNARCGAP